MIEPPPPPPGLPLTRCGTCTLCRPSTPLTPWSEAGIDALLVLANALRPSCVRTRTMFVWNADCTVPAEAVAETSTRLDEIETSEKPCCFSQAATAFASASLGPYFAVNCAGERLGWFGLAMNACNDASLRSFSETVTRSDWVGVTGPATMSPTCNAAGCATTWVPAGAAAKASVAAVRPSAATRLFKGNLFGIGISLGNTGKLADMSSPGHRRPAPHKMHESPVIGAFKPPAHALTSAGHCTLIGFANTCHAATQHGVRAPMRSTFVAGCASRYAASATRWPDADPISSRRERSVQPSI